MTSCSTPLSYTTAFRIVAWKACCFADRRWELGPGYYCPTCVLPEKDIANDCPRCPLTELFESVYRAEAEKEIKLRGTLPEGLTLNALMETYAIVSESLSDNNDKISPAWDVHFARLARIVLEERNQQRYTNQWNDWRKQKDQK